MTFADDAPFVILTNEIEAPIFCLSSILGVIARVVVGDTFSMLRYSVFPFGIMTGL